ncbi:MAG: hypothetical protein ACYC6P_09130, partial [Ignavibacteriaceae bacterium]
MIKKKPTYLAKAAKYYPKMIFPKIFSYLTSTLEKDFSMQRFSFISSSLAKNFFLYFTSTLILALLFFAQSCKGPTAPHNNDNITLSLNDVSCTEAWLNVKVQSVSSPVMLTIKSGSQVLYTTSLSGSDSLIYIDSLLPNKNYSLQGF